MQPFNNDSRKYHRICIDATIPPFNTIHGFQQLDEESKQYFANINLKQQQELDEFNKQKQALADTEHHEPTFVLDEDLAEDMLPKTNHIRHMEWWDSMPWDSILTMNPATAAFASRNLRHAIANFKHKICLQIEAAAAEQNQPSQTKLWKLLWLYDAIIYTSTSRRDSKPTTERTNKNMGGNECQRN